LDIHFFFLCSRNKEKEKRIKEKRKCEGLASLCSFQGKERMSYRITFDFL